MSAQRALAVRVARRLGAFQLDVAFDAAPAGVTVLFGPSGAGKSQTLAAVAGALRPDAGRITLGDQVLFDSEARIDTPLERRTIGWVTQDGALFPHLSVEANLRYGLRRARGRDAGVRFDDVVEMLGVGPLLARRPAGLSGGERQRVAMGRALLSQPHLLLMDEPLAALDGRRRAGVLPYLERLKATCRLPMLYVTHATAEVVRLADRLVLIDEGRVRAQGSPMQVFAEAGPALAGRPQDTIAVIEGRVAAHDATRGLSWIEAGPTRLATPPLAQAVGAPIRAAVPAGDVLLAREPPRGLSARNVVAARIETLADKGGGIVLARLRLPGDVALWSALTRDAVAELELGPDVEVFAILGSIAVQDATEIIPSRRTEA